MPLSARAAPGALSARPDWTVRAPRAQSRVEPSTSRA